MKKREYEDGVAPNLLDSCYYLRSLIKRNIITLRSKSYKVEVENILKSNPINLLYEYMIENLPDIDSYSFTDCIIMAKLLNFWIDYVPNSAIDAKIAQQKTSQSAQAKIKFINSEVSFDFRNPVKKKSRNLPSRFTMNTYSMQILLEVLEDCIGKNDSDLVVDLYKILAALSMKDNSILSDDSIISKEYVESIYADSDHSASCYLFDKVIFYKDALQVYYWDRLFMELSNKISGVLYDSLAMYLKLPEEDGYAVYMNIKEGTICASDLLSCSYNDFLYEYWQDNNSDTKACQTAYAICYTICLSNKIDVKDGRALLIREKLTSDICDIFEPLWSKIKLYAEYESKCKLDSQLLSEEILFSTVDIDVAIGYLKFIYDASQKKDAIVVALSDDIVSDNTCLENTTPKSDKQSTQCDQENKPLVRTLGMPVIFDKLHSRTQEVALRELYKLTTASSILGAEENDFLYAFGVSIKGYDKKMFKKINWKKKKSLLQYFIIQLYTNEKIKNVERNTWINAMSVFNINDEEIIKLSENTTNNLKSLNEDSKMSINDIIKKICDNHLTR